MLVGWDVVCYVTVSYADHLQAQASQGFFLSAIFHSIGVGAESSRDVSAYTVASRITAVCDIAQASYHLSSECTIWLYPPSIIQGWDESGTDI